MQPISRLAILWGVIYTPVFFFSGCGSGVAVPPTAPDKPSSGAVESPLILGRTLCLTTDTYPDSGFFGDRLTREIARQGVLIAAREDLGMLTRDQTLGEVFPDSLPDPDGGEPLHVSPLGLRVRCSDDGEWSGVLLVDGDRKRAPLWEIRGELGGPKASVYAKLATEVDSVAGAIAARLEASGAVDANAPLNAESEPSQNALRRLGEMNFVSQYAAAREAHRSLRDEGPSTAWYGVLVRAYAHLAALTHHTWSSHSDAFAARSLVYAERLARLREEDSLSRQHRAYAYAMLGMHALAESETAAIDDLAPEEGVQPPAWTAFARSVSAYDHASIDRIGAEHPELSETAAYLQWKLYYSYLHGRWVYEKGLGLMQACPEAYGVYSAFANWKALRIQRVGSRAGHSAFSGLLPRRVLTLAGLPDAAREAALPAGADRLSNPSETPMRLSRALMASSEEETDAEFSWGILGRLIAEEQFVLAADLLKVSGNAVERSKAQLVESLAPLVEGHRYQSYIASYGYGPSERSMISAELAKLSIVDPRSVMAKMLVRAWDLHLAEGMCGSELGVRATEHATLSMPSLLATYHHVLSRWTNHFDNKDRLVFLQNFAFVSPHSPSARRHRFFGDKFERGEEIRQLEEGIGTDPLGWMAAAQAYSRIGDEDNAIRCYQESLSISPCLDATESLAKLHYAKGQKDKWETTLKSYLELEDLGLTHAQIHKKLANEHINRRAWEKAEPHALEAAQTYSAWGLLLAARTYEGMQDFESSQRYYSRASSSYPSYHSGTEWYFACQRTGTGDLDASRAIAAKSIAVARSQRYYDSLLRIALYRWLEGDHNAAIEQMRGPVQQSPDSAAAWTRSYNLLVTACIASESGNKEAREQAINGLRAVIGAEEITQYPDWVIVLNGICDLFTNQKPPEGFSGLLDKALAETTNDYRCDYSFFAGAAFEHAGRRELAEKHYAFAAFQPPFKRYTGTFAGRRLVAWHGSERGGLPQEFDELEADAQREQDDADNRENETPDP